MSRQLFTTISLLLAISFCVLNCHAKSLGEDGEEQLPEPTIEYLGDCSNEPKVKESCDELCGENSCRNRLQEKSLLPVEHFCFCNDKLPQNSASHHCHAETENSTLRDECQMTCFNLFDQEGNEYADYYCSPQNPQTRSSEEHCLCVQSSSIPQSDNDFDIQNPRAGKRRPKPTQRPTNGASCSPNPAGGNTAAIQCQIGSCYAVCPDGTAAGSFVPSSPSNNNNNGNMPAGGSNNLFDNNQVVFTPGNQGS